MGPCKSGIHQLVYLSNHGRSSLVIFIENKMSYSELCPDNPDAGIAGEVLKGTNVSGLTSLHCKHEITRSQAVLIIPK